MDDDPDSLEIKYFNAIGEKTAPRKMRDVVGVRLTMWWKDQKAMHKGGAVGPVQ